MSINQSNGAAAQESLYAPTPPAGYGLWFTGDYQDVPVDDATLKQRQEAIESYYAGYTTAYNNMKGKSYACKFAWVESASGQANCQCFTLYVFVTPEPTYGNATNQADFSADFSAEEFAARGGGDGDDIDPPKPPAPPPPYL